MPVSWPDDPELEWCPPGHGDVYVSLRETGLIAALRARGIRWAFISNADNLGATCDPDLAAWVMTNEVPYLAEVCERTPNDRKGGHLAVRKSDGRLVLRDSAMTPPEDDVHFQDVTRHTTFHANSLWVDLDVLDRLLDERDGVLGLPVIVNRKTVDPSRKDSTKVIQIETAMGAAIETIDGARAVRVPRERFRPVKTTNELLMIRSDLFTLSDDSTIVAARAAADPRVDLDPAYFALVPAFEKRVPAGPPSLLGATSFTVRGPVTFGAEVTVVGDVHVESADELVIAAGTTLTGDATGDVAGEG
jgi:UTP--glucose-1-phosphate uridylyltransferase